MRRLTTFVALAVLLVAPAGAQVKISGSAPEGRLLFHSPALSGNGLACTNCHADFDEVRRNDGLIRAGHSLENAASRQTFWGQELDSPDRYPDISSAAVVCVETYLQRPDKLTAQQKLSLETYLRAIDRQPVVLPLAYAPAADLTGEYAGFGGGDKRRGRELFYAACHVCHPNGNSGLAPAIPRGKEPAFYARKVREGNGLGAVLSGLDPNAYDRRSGLHMPFFGADRLSNGDIRDIVAYLMALAP
ncbi:MAG: c-type cytochrome [Gemmatimonadota bacterium]